MNDIYDFLTYKTKTVIEYKPSKTNKNKFARIYKTFSYYFDFYN